MHGEASQLAKKKYQQRSAFWSNYKKIKKNKKRARMIAKMVYQVGEVQLTQELN